jgi:histidine ammonia-lyase
LAGKAAVRNRVDFLDIDRPLYKDHNAMADAVAKIEILEAVENEIGSLGT